MENNKNDMESGFRIENLILLESNFQRTANVTFNDPAIKQNTNVDIAVNVESDVLIVREKLDYSQKYNDIEQVKCSIVMLGVFRKIGESKVADLEKFGRINGAAIIFPYIREHLSNLSQKAGIGLILIPPANFTNPTIPQQEKKRKDKSHPHK